MLQTRRKEKEASLGTSEKSASGKKMTYALVAVQPYPLSLFDYKIPSSLKPVLHVGDKVLVPFRKKEVFGYVTSKKNTTLCKKVLPILSYFPKERIEPHLFSLATWMAKYYCTPLSKVLFTMLPKVCLTPPKESLRAGVYLLRTKKETLTEIAKLREKFPKRASLLEKLLKEKTLLTKDLSSYSSQIKTLIEKKWIGKKNVLISSELFLQEEYFLSKKKTLTKGQERAYNEVKSSLLASSFDVFLLHGITGSGKTEIYLQATEKARDLGKDVIILVPEVALTSQLIEKFRARFPEEIGVLHHRRPPKEKAATWKKLREGSVHIVLGARSAVFAPIKNLGLLIVDEEHDNSYKQTEEMPTYHARDIAIKRASLERATVLLGSATPSLESYYKALHKKYHLLSLESRIGSSSLPDIKLVAMQEAVEKEGVFTHFSSELLDGIKKRMQKGEQTLLFFNRRGYRTSSVCTKCTRPIRCAHCDLSLTFHKKENKLRCHLCHFTMAPPRNCPYCGALDKACYKGFGTEHIESSLHKVLPEVRTLRMDRDTTQKTGSHEDIFRAFRSGKADVLIGTQMIAKGFHFPSVTLVGILQPERTLFLPDFRSPETVFQLVTQVAGRAGRAELPGEVLIQTYLPEDPTILLAKEQQYLHFYKKEIQGRETFSYPPFSRFIKILLSSPKRADTRSYANLLFEKIQRSCKEDTVYPITEPTHEKAHGRYRLYFLLRTFHIQKTTHLIKEITARFSSPKSLRILIDVDTISTL